MDSIQLKIEFEGSLRRASVNRGEALSLAKLKQTLSALVGLPDCAIKYRDEENDLITLGSDAELADFLSQAGTNKVLRVVVTPSNDHSTPPPPSEPVPEPAAAAPAEPEIPWVNLARALAQPEIVARVQQVLQSPILTEAVNRAAQGYVDSKGDFVIAALMASQQLPLVMGVIAELLEELPVLKDLQTLALRGFQEGFASFCPPCGPPHPHGPHGHHPHGPHGHHPHGPHGHHPHGPHGHCPPHDDHHAHGPHDHHAHGPHDHHAHGPHDHHPHGPHDHHPHGPHGPRHHQGGGQDVPKHFGVFCDGCGSDADLQKASVQNGHQTRRGFIRGLRYKSQTVHDFDLCESCKNSDRFPDRAYGPFDKVDPPQGQGRCRNPWWTNGAGGGCRAGNWRANGRQPPAPAAQEEPKEKPVAPEFDFLNAIRSAVSRGTEAFVQASKNEQNDFGDIARAIAESLKEDKPKTTEAAPVAATAPPAEDWVPVATPATPPQPQQAKADDPFVKWATQLSQLEALGFDRTETYITFLEEEKGDLDRVVSRIVSRDL